MINFDLTTQFATIKVLIGMDGRVTIEPLEENAIDKHRKEFIAYVKVHTPFENIKSIIKEYQGRRKICEEMGEILINLLTKVKDVGKNSSAEDLLFEIEISMAMKAQIMLENSKAIANRKIPESFIYDILGRLDQEFNMVSTVISNLEDFISIQKDSKKKEETKFSNPEIAMAFNILHAVSKESHYRITEKNASEILKLYSKGSTSIIVFLRTVNDNNSLENMKKCNETNKTSASRKRESLFQVKELITIIDKSNKKARAKVDEIIAEYLQNYRAIY